jgi:predicted metal-dependent phosphoesterase TrpH
MRMKFDLHIHTRRYSPDSVIDPLALVQRARRMGLDGLVITEHDWLWTEEELNELRAVEPGLRIFAGVEVSAREGHFLVHGIKDPFALAKGIAIRDLCREVHRQGGAVVAAHPYPWGQPFDAILREARPELDGLEVMTSNMDRECRRLAAMVHRQQGWTGLGSSDAHEEGVLAFCYTEFPQAIRDQRDLVEALRSGQATARERIGAEQL